VRRPSLGGRLLLASALLLPLFLGLAGYGLESSFRRALRAAELEQLKLQSYLLLGAAELDQGRLVLPEPLSEPRYGHQGSGLYARFDDRQGRSVWQSPSAELLRLPPTRDALASGESEFAEARAGKVQLFVYRYGLVWEDGNGNEHPFQLSVWHHQATYRAELASYRRSLFVWLGCAALLLLALQLIILRWGLRPLRLLASDLERVEAGEMARLGGDYPSEVAGVTDNLDHLLASEQGRRERYRHTLADLAHSLKTPLAVLRAALDTNAEPEALRELCDEQLDRMEKIVGHQLSRAARRGARPLGAAVVLKGVAQRLVAALEKVYRDKGLRFELDLPEELIFRGDESDLMEMLGNLLDNACKYGRGEVRLSARDDGAALTIEVADDGPGISPAQRSRILRRGVRADHRAPGQGIGLAVVLEIAASYGGELRLAASPGGGSLFELQLPHASRRREP